MSEKMHWLAERRERIGYVRATHTEEVNQQGRELGFRTAA